MIVFGIHCNFFIVLPIPLKTCKYNGFLFSKKQNVHAQKIGRVSEVLRAWARPIAIGHAIFSGLASQKLLVSEVLKLVKLILLVPITNAVRERSRSTLCRVKSYLPSSMTQERLSSRLIVTTYKK